MMTPHKCLCGRVNCFDNTCFTPLRVRKKSVIDCVSHIGVNTPSSFTRLHILQAVTNRLPYVSQTGRLISCLAGRKGSWEGGWDRRVWVEMQKLGIQNDWKTVCAWQEAKSEEGEERERGCESS